MVWGYGWMRITNEYISKCSPYILRKRKRHSHYLEVPLKAALSRRFSLERNHLPYRIGVHGLAMHYPIHIRFSHHFVPPIILRAEDMRHLGAEKNAHAITRLHLSGAHSKVSGFAETGKHLLFRIESRSMTCYLESSMCFRPPLL